MQPPYQTPKDAITGLIEAYRSFDVDRIVENKDFEVDSRLFWQDLGLPISEGQLAEATKAFETNFRKTMEDGIPDYSSVSFAFVEQEQLGENIEILTVRGLTTAQESFQLKLAAVRTERGWKAARAPGYDHL